MMRRTRARCRSGIFAALLAAALAIAPQALQARGGGHSGAGGGSIGGHSGYVGHGGFAHGHGGGHFGGAVVIGGVGFWPWYGYPYHPYYAYYPNYATAYPYGYEPTIIGGYSVPAPTQVWYYCDAAANYYPYVTTCPGRWREVAATPAAPASAQ